MILAIVAYLKAVVSSVYSLSERIEKWWIVCTWYKIGGNFTRYHKKQGWIKWIKGFRLHGHYWCRFDRQVFAFRPFTAFRGSYEKGKIAHCYVSCGILWLKSQITVANDCFVVTILVIILIQSKRPTRLKTNPVRSQWEVWIRNTRMEIETASFTAPWTIATHTISNNGCTYWLEFLSQPTFRSAIKIG